MNEKLKEVFLVLHNHFDPIWRRCWDREFEYGGKVYRCYADLEECIIKDWLDTAEDSGAVITEGQAVVWRKFLERNPDRLQQMRRLRQSGQLELTIGGEVVPDTNMPCGESLVRNYLYGLLWYEEVFGAGSWIPVGTLEDAFGSSAQLPAIFRGMGARFLMDLSYEFVPGDYWRGLDGSVICIKRDFPLKAVTSYHKYAPCQQCKGVGCELCEGTGLEMGVRATAEEILKKIGECEFQEFRWCVIKIGGEEYMPCLDMKTVFEQANNSPVFKERGAEGDASLSVKPAGYIEVYDRLKPYIDRTETTTEISEAVEGNPVFTGCLVTEIRLKQRFRELEHRLLAVEKLRALTFSMGESYPEKALVQLWRTLLFTAFHDAITGTHIRAAYLELHEMFDSVDQGLRDIEREGMSQLASKIGSDDERPEISVLLFNPLNWERRDPAEITFPLDAGMDIKRLQMFLPDGEKVKITQRQVSDDGQSARLTFISPSVPSFGYRVLRVKEADFIDDPVVTENKIENEFFRVEIDKRGIRRIVDKANGMTILGDREWYVNELLLEEDVGNPWQTRKPPAFRHGLSGWTTTSKVATDGGWPKIVVQGQYDGPDSGVKKLQWRQEVWLLPDRKEIEFRTTIDWDTAQRRVRLAFPTFSRADEATYEIPYGALNRKRYEGEHSRLTAGDGDWPAVRWASVHDREEDYAVTLLNRGTPCYRVEEGVILLSVLRSPTDAWVLNEPEFYDCPDFDNARDAGRHEFRYRIVAHPGKWSTGGEVRRGWEFNSPVLSSVISPGGGHLPAQGCSLLQVENDQVVVTTLKKAERDDSLILRAYETSGQRTSCELKPEFPCQVFSSTNMLEDESGEPVDPLKLTFGAFEIKTLRLNY